MISYRIPDHWIRYDFRAIFQDLVEAKVAIATLKAMPYQKEWVEELQRIQLKREVAGTSRIEGAEFTEEELDQAMTAPSDELHTRSQRQAGAAVRTYEWIATLPDDRIINRNLIEEIHRRIITGADDDHCPPGRIRTTDQNVNFGHPKHRGCSGGAECENALITLLHAAATSYREHDPLIQALAVHFHLAAMHPFLDGNGRTVRALEALHLQRAGLRQTCFIAMSNYYYEEKPAYLAALPSVSRESYDLTPFLRFGLRGIVSQSRRLLSEIEANVKKAVFMNLAHDLFSRLESPRKRVIGARQLEILRSLATSDGATLPELVDDVAAHYTSVKDGVGAFARDFVGLVDLGTIKFAGAGKERRATINLDWPRTMSESIFFEQINRLPSTKGQQYLRQIRSGKRHQRKVAET